MQNGTQIWKLGSMTDLGGYRNRLKSMKYYQFDDHSHAKVGRLWLIVFDIRLYFFIQSKIPPINFMLHAWAIQREVKRLNKRKAFMHILNG